MVRIPLSQGGPNAGLYEAIVDDEDADLSDLRWSFLPTKGRSKGYAFRRSKMAGGKPHQTMHRAVLERAIGRAMESGEQCDHVDGNGLNNRRHNLRLATSSQNCKNRRPHGVSQYLGVYFHGPSGKWLAQISAVGVRRHIGLFANEEDAASAYDRAAREHHGEFARLNFPDGGDA